jgi:hypothetical protein
MSISKTSTPSNTSNRSMRSFTGVHDQNKVRTWYHRKKAPRYVKARVRRQYKQYKRLKNMDMPMQHFHKTSIYDNVSGNNKQGIIYIPFLSMSNTIANSPYNQVREILLETSNDTVDEQQRKVYFKQNTSEIIMRNIGANHTAICTLYYVVCKKDLPLDECAEQNEETGDTLSPLDLIKRNNQLRQVDNDSGGNDNDFDKPGMPLFNSNHFCRYFTITKTQKLVLEPGETYVTQLRKRNIGSFREDDIDNLAAKRYKTGGIVLVHHGVWAGSMNESTHMNVEVQTLTNVKFYDMSTETPAYTGLPSTTSVPTTA